MPNKINTIELLSPAKVNFFLEVTGKRADGYHNLRTLMCPVGLFDTIRLNFETDRTLVICDHPEVPADSSNLVHRAAVLFFHEIGIEQPVVITIEKKIPVGAGLGGGSSNAAAVLLGLNKYYNYLLSNDKLISMGARIGADVPFFILARPALATGIGERLSPCGKLVPYTMLLVNPGFPVSTALVFKNLNLRLTKCKKKISNLPFKEDFLDVREYLCNDLETVTASMFPEIDGIKRSLLDLGARGALMSGSGPTVFGLFSNTREAEQASRNLPSCGWKHTFVVEMLQ
ncbi:MAG: 4-(cytidine 5'-diphospho)-2-C-methyl-D-erythritol kinase [Thermodesulfobacteriota bacterium]